MLPMWPCRTCGERVQVDIGEGEMSVEQWTVILIALLLMCVPVMGLGICAVIPGACM